MTLRTVVAGNALIALLVMSGTAAAQGRGRGVGNGPQGPPPSQVRNGSQTSSAPRVQTSTSVTQFGTWLDDAATAAPGLGYASIGTSYWRGSNTTQINAPILGVTYGVAKRAQLSATIPFYRVSYDGFSGSGLDNMYFTASLPS